MDLLELNNAKIKGKSIYEYNKNTVVVSPTEPTGEARKKVWLQHSNNLITNVTYNKYYNPNTSQIETNSKYAMTNFIEVQTGIDYIFSHELGTSNGGILAFDKNFNFIEIFNSDTITTTFRITNSNIKFILFDIWSNEITNDTWLMFNSGVEALPYEPYVEDKEYILNDNDIYEVFNIDKGTTLYNNSSGSNQDIILNGNIDDYKEIEIEYYVVSDNNRYSKKVALMSGTDTNTSLSAIMGTVVGGSEQTIYTTNIGIIRTTNKIGFGRSATIVITNGNVALTTNNNIYIKKVIGYK